MILNLDNEKLNEILLDFYTLTRARTVIYDCDFKRIAAYPENSCKFCSLIKSIDATRALCRKDEKEACVICSKKNDLYIYKCHAGLIEVVAPIKMNDLIIGYIMFGQIINNKEDLPSILEYASNYIEDEMLLSKALYKLRVKDNKQIKAAAAIMQACTNYLWLSGMIKINGDNNIFLLNNFIDQNISEDLSVDKLCSVLKVSRVGLYNLSHKCFGMSIAKYIRKKRITLAEKYLSEHGLSVADVAKKVGIFDYNYFSKVFKKETGMIPSEYKTLKRKT